MESHNKNENDDLRIINESIQKLLELDEQERKIHKAQKSKIDTIQSVLDRYCSNRNIKEKMAKNEEASALLRQAKKLISKLRTLV